MATKQIQITQIPSETKYVKLPGFKSLFWQPF